MHPKYIAVHTQSITYSEGETKDEALENLCDEQGLDHSNYEEIRLYQIIAEFEVKPKAVITLTSGKEI